MKNRIVKKRVKKRTKKRILKIPLVMKKKIVKINSCYPFEMIGEVKHPKSSPDKIAAKRDAKLIFNILTERCYYNTYHELLVLIGRWENGKDGKKFNPSKRES